VQCFVDDCFLFINGNLVDSLEKKKESKSDSYYAAVLANTNDANNTRVSGYLNQIEVYSGISPYQAVVSYMNCSDFIANWDPAKTLVHWTQFLAAFPPEDKSTPGQCETFAISDDPDDPYHPDDPCTTDVPDPEPPNPDRIPPVAINCPEPQYVVSENRLKSCTWNEPNWSDAHGIVSIESNYRNGDVFYW
ncbi:hypothetical protein PENTCL1PPCAC_9788, partial [Pristionchus entomophagus]